MLLLLLMLAGPMSSLKAIERKAASRRQVYRPLLESPFCGAAQAWPHVAEQRVVLELLRNTVLSRYVPLASASGNASMLPCTDYNEIMAVLDSGSGSGSGSGIAGAGPREYLLFACTRDAKTAPPILMQQVAVAAQLSRHQVTLVQLPQGSLDVFAQCNVPAREGLLLLECAGDTLDPRFVAAVRDRVQDPSPAPWLQAIGTHHAADLRLLRSTVANRDKSKSKNRDSNKIKNKNRK